MVQDAYIQLNPFVTPAGDIVCLVQQLGTGDAKPIAKPESLNLSMRFYAGRQSRRRVDYRIIADYGPSLRPLQGGCRRFRS
jgi:hypothetical protein